ncbi:MAG TPA: YgjP-like metallopeptidase domain-containing protein, partial [Candidatus Kapabacteria bacterium]|nr:YgjP-like metallopeptidase domain-containing protein [Candidatus Kapabacteria bacterium]
MPELYHNGQSIPYTVRRNTGKRIRIVINCDAAVSVAAPRRIPEETVHAWVRTKASWIVRTVAHMKNTFLPLPTDQVMRPSYATCKARAKKRIMERLDH